MIIKCSYHQERLWFIDEFESGTLYEESPTYHNVPILIKLFGELDVLKLNQSFLRTIKRHEALRTTIQSVDGVPSQVIGKVDFELTTDRLDEWNEVNEALFRGLAFVEQPFALSRGSLIKAQIIEYQSYKYVLAVGVHHIVFDKKSIEILVSEVFDQYRLLIKGSEIQLPELPIQYADFSHWQQNFSNEVLNYHLFFWKKKFKEAPEPLALPSKVREAVHIYEPASKTLRIPKNITSQLSQLSTDDKVEVKAIFLSAFYLLLYKYAQQLDITIGISAENRTQPGTENVIGPFANLLPLRLKIEPKEMIKSFIAAVQRSVDEVLEYQSLPFDRLTAELDLENDMSRTVLFDVLFQYEEKKVCSPRIDGLHTELITTNLGWGKYDLNFLVKNEEEDTSIILVYNAFYYSEEMMIRMLESYEVILQEIITDSSVYVAQARYLSPERKEFILTGFNTTDTQFPENQTITAIFEKQSEISPESIALILNHKVFTYHELNQKSNQIAHYLRAVHRVRPNELVGVAIDRSELMIVSILAILKAGAGYVPIEKGYPDDRRLYMIDNAQLKLVLTDSEEMDGISSATTINLTKSDNLIWEQPTTNPDRVNSSKDIAYIIYTSGSTGQPKGCMVEHRNLVSLFFNDHVKFDFSDSDVWIMAHSYCFDFSVWEMYGALLFGGRLVVPLANEVKDVRIFYQLIAKNGVTILNQTPGAFYHLAVQDELEVSTRLDSLRYVIFGGDKLVPDKVANWVKNYPLDEVALINMYGITETTIHVTYHPLSRKDIMEDQAISPIGKPLPGVKIYVLDEYLEPVDVGVIGEVYVAGNGVSRGYLFNDSLTKDRFLTVPFLKERVYKTGDLAGWMPDGNLVYKGRKDDQLKIRGHRVEVGEIEATLRSHENIASAIVVKRGIEQQQYLVAYYIGEEIANQKVKDFMYRNLPAFMVPDYFVFLSQFPLTSNGKIAYSKLPDPVASGVGQYEYVKPSNVLELELVVIWQEILKREKIGVYDNFFEIGGHSLKATQMLHLVAKKLNRSIELKTVFNHPTIRELATILNGEQYFEEQPIPRVEAAEYYPLSHAQKRQWIIDRLDKEKIASYNITRSFIIEGVLNSKALEKAIAQVIDRHESLRTVYRVVDGEPRQKILWAEELNWKIDHIYPEKLGYGDADIQQLAIKEETTRFDLEKGPLIRVKVIHQSSGQYILLFTIHHIVSDGWSMDLLMSEVTRLYQGYGCGMAIDLEALPIQYKDFSAWQNQLLECDAYDEHFQFWKNQLSGNLPRLDFPTDYKRPIVKSNRGAVCSLLIETYDYQQLKRISRSHKSSLFSVLLAAVKALLYRYTGQKDIIIGIPVSGRVHSDLKDQIGYYVNTLAIRTHLDTDNSFEALARQVHHRIIEGISHQVYPFDKLVDKLDLPKDLSRTPIFDVMVAFQSSISVEQVRELVSITGVENYAIKGSVSRFDMTFYFQESEEGILLNLEYCTDLYQEERISKLLDHYRTLIASVLRDPTLKLSHIDLIGQAEQDVLVHTFNDRISTHPDHHVIQQLFETQVEKTPDILALVAGDVSFTYSELNRESNRLAHYLVDSWGVEPNDFIGLMTSRSEWMIIGILAILKANAVYVPLDPSCPNKRKEYMIFDAKIRFVLSDQSYEEDLLVNMIEISNYLKCADGLSDINPPILSQADDLIYIMYTSGSTGKPKGVMIEHKNVVNMVKSTNYHTLATGDRILQLSNYSFDASVFEIFGSLLHGATLYIMNKEDVLDTRKFKDYVKKKDINIIFITTALLNSLIELNSTCLTSFDKIYFGGECASVSSIRKALHHCKHHDTLVHMYGPTEATTFSTYYVVSQLDECAQSVPIGSSITNTSVYILNEEVKLQPIGVPGEICIGGRGVARGYLYAEKLTNEKFVKDPFHEGGMLYRTGDIGQWRSDGAIEFIGRSDAQVKLRGFRIELGEIKYAMEAFNEVHAAHVMVNEDHGHKHIIGYYLAEGPIADLSLQDHLSSLLPDYMIPSQLILVDRFPLNHNGKIDSEKLLAEFKFKTREEVYIAPQNEIETELERIWGNLFHLSQVSIEHNFFEIGGDSLKLIKLHLQISEAYPGSVSITDLFSNSTIRKQSLFIGQKLETGTDALSQIIEL